MRNFQPSFTFTTRMKRMVDLIIDQSGVHSIADVGADHGFLTLALANAFPSKQIYYSDISVEGRRTAMSHAARFGVPNNNITFYVGDGVRPLLKNVQSCDVIVIANIGINHIIDIVALNTLEFDSDKGTTYKILHSQFSNIKLSGLSELNTKQLIVQPAVPNIIGLLALYKVMFRNGWDLHEQTIDFGALNQNSSDSFDNPSNAKDPPSYSKNMFRYPSITNSFVLAGHQLQSTLRSELGSICRESWNGNSNSLSDCDMLLQMPIFSRLRKSDVQSDSSTILLLQNYLLVNRANMTNRLVGLRQLIERHRNKGDATAVDCYEYCHETVQCLLVEVNLLLEHCREKLNQSALK